MTIDLKRRIRSPHAQIVFATMVMMGGGYLIALWCVGLMMILGGILFAADAFLRDIKPADEDLSSHEAILRRYQNSP